MRILFDSKNKEYKVPFGCIRQYEKCTLRVKIPVHCKTQKCFVIIEDYSGFLLKTPLFYKETINDYEIYSGAFSLANRGLYHYYFNIETKHSTFNLFKEGYNQTNMGMGEKWQITCYDKDYDTPSFFKGAIYYQIFPDRFFKSGNPDLKDKLLPYTVHENTEECPVYLPNENGKIMNNDFYGGNLRGIIEKLNYIKDLGVSVIYLNPVFMAHSNHRYDTADYKRIDPMLGDENDFKTLCDTAHQKGIKIIIDCAFSHTGSNSIYFDKMGIFGGGAVSDPNSKYRSWYNFIEYPSKYHSWWGIDTLPCVNELDEGFLDYIIFDDDSVVSKYLNLGADGIRLDVADELPDEFLSLLKKRVKEIKSDALVIGEVWEDASNKESYGIRRRYFVDSTLDSVMNYPYQNAIIGFVNETLRGYDFANVIMTIAENYPKPVLDCVMTSLSTHDTQRILTVMSNPPHNLSRDEKARYKIPNKELAVQKLKICAFLQFFLPGGAAIYYGDEAGLQGFEDPFNRRYFPWESIDSDILSFYKEIAKIKNEADEFKTGEIEFEFANEKTLVFKRFSNDKTYTIIASCDDRPFYYETNKNVVFSKNVNIENNKIAVFKNGFAILEQ